MKKLSQSVVEETEPSVKDKAVQPDESSDVESTDAASLESEVALNEEDDVNIDDLELESMDGDDDIDWDDAFANMDDEEKE